MNDPPRAPGDNQLEDRFRVRYIHDALIELAAKLLERMRRRAWKGFVGKCDDRLIDKILA